MVVKGYELIHKLPKRGGGEKKGRAREGDGGGTKSEQEDEKGSERHTHTHTVILVSLEQLGAREVAASLKTC